MSRRNSIIDERGRNFIVKLHEYFERESQNGGPLLPVQQVLARVKDALGVSRSTISRILKEKYGASGMEDNELKTPGQTRKRAKKDKTLCGVKNQSRSKSKTNDTNKDSVVPEVISTETAASSDKNDNLPIAKDEQNPKKRKRKLKESDTFNVDELLNYKPQNHKPPSVTQNTVVDHSISETTASDGQVEKDAILDVEQSELISYKIYKEKSQPAIINLQDVDTFINNSPIVGHSSPAHKINISPALEDHRKSIAKADFKIGRINLPNGENVIEKTTKISRNSDMKTSTREFDIGLIKDHVKAYHTRNEAPTVRTLLISLRDSGLFSGSKETLLEILEKVGFLFNKPRKT